VARHDATTWKLPVGYKPLRGKNVGARKKSSRLLGHLLISRGGLEWRPRGGRYNREMTWEEFAERMK
jgi:hypothetical protein